MIRIEHVGVAVSDLSRSNDLFKRLLGQEHYKTEQVDAEQVNTSFFSVGESKLELLGATSQDSPIWKYIQKRGEGIHHIALAVDDIHKEMQRLKDEGFQLLNEEPKRGADNKLICFLHPKSTNGVLVELCQDI